MGFGASTLLLGNLASALFESTLGWRMTYVLLGGIILVVLVLVGLLLQRPSAVVTLPAPKKATNRRGEDFEVRDMTTVEMLKRFTYWRAFLCLVFITAVGSSVISFARDLAVATGAEAALATTLVGVLSVCNGLGRILTGVVFDALGRRFTMLAANILTIIAAGVTLAAVMLGSLPLCIVGLCLSGISYGTSPTMSSAFTASFYGQKYFASNFSMTNCNLMGASIMATVCGSLMASSGGYVAPFILLLVLSVAALGLNISIRKP